MPKPQKNVRLDRHSATGTRGLPVKQGLKGWGKMGEETEEQGAIDERDPNYVQDDEVEEEHGEQDHLAPKDDK